MNQADQFFEDIKALPDIQSQFESVRPLIERTDHFRFYTGLALEGGKANVEHATMQIAVMFFLLGFYASSSPTLLSSISSNETDSSNEKEN